MRKREQKKKNMQVFAESHGQLFRTAPNWDEQGLVSGLDFGNNRSSASIITNRDKDTIYVSEQSGLATKNPLAVVSLSGAETIATDSYCDRGLHAEMQTIYQLLMEWKSAGHEWQEFNIKSAVQFLEFKIGGGRSVAKDKGTCRLCAAILLKLGVDLGYIQASKFESIWKDPFEEAGLENPWF